MFTRLNWFNAFVISLIIFALGFSVFFNWHLFSLVKNLEQPTKPAEIKSQKIIKNKPAPMPVSKPVSKPESKINFQKIKSPPTESDIVAGINTQAINLIKSGRALEAEQLLFDKMKIHPKFSILREQLVKLYFNQDRMYEAEQVLQGGLIQMPENKEYLLLSGHIYHKNKKYQQVIDCLSKISNPTTDCLALLASSYYETGMYNQAIEHYQKLIALDDSKSKYWLGLALAQEAAGKKQHALTHYQKVSSLGQLSTDILQYVNNKISELSDIDQYA